MFAIMQETTSDNPQLLADYYGGELWMENRSMLPTIFNSFGEAVKIARQFTESLKEKPDAVQTAEFTVLHNGGIETTFTIFELKHTPSY